MPLKVIISIGVVIVIQKIYDTGFVQIKLQIWLRFTIINQVQRMSTRAWFEKYMYFRSMVGIQRILVSPTESSDITIMHIYERL